MSMVEQLLQIISSELSVYDVMSVFRGKWCWGEGVGEMREGEGVGEMREGEGVGEMREGEGVGEMREGEGVGEMREGEGVGEMREGEGVELELQWHFDSPLIGQVMCSHCGPSSHL